MRELCKGKDLSQRKQLLQELETRKQKEISLVFERERMMMLNEEKAWQNYRKQYGRLTSA